MTSQDLGPGEPILGHPTHKYSVTMSYVAQTTVLGAPCKRTMVTVPAGYATISLPPRPTRTPAGSAANEARRVKMKSTLKARVRASICDP
jgi:hypothetical protein